MVKWGVLFIIVLCAASVSLLFLRGTYTPTPDIDGFIGSKDVFGVGDSLVINDGLSKYAENLESGGPPPDGIPPIDDPQYISVADADEFLEDQGPVFILEMNGEVRVYPQQVMVWHEVVNDTFGGQDVSVTYSPLSGSAIAYTNAFDDEMSDFGTSGQLLNSNLVLYDRATESLFPQILGIGISGEHRGVALEQIPLTWAPWGRAKQMYPQALVLSKKTGFIKSYGFDPYGSYLKEGTYYDSDHIFFPVMNEDSRLAPKEVVIGVKGREENVAFLKSAVQENGTLQTTLDGGAITAVWDDDLAAVHVYRPPYADANGKLYEDADVVPSFDVMWFAWNAYYPGAELVGLVE